jgi:hypothetical protein
LRVGLFELALTRAYRQIWFLEKVVNRSHRDV